MMLAAAISASEAGRYVSADVSLAAINQPGLCVFSGDEEKLRQRQEEWSQAGIFTARLNTSHAFHSARMDAILEPFGEVLRSKHLNPPELPFYSCLTGEPVTSEMAVNPEYWTAQLRGTVNFSAMISGCLANEDNVFLEIGPGQTLCRLAKAQTGSDRLVLSSLGTTAATSEAVVFVQTLSQLWLAGVPVQWSSSIRRSPAGGCPCLCTVLTGRPTCLGQRFQGRSGRQRRSRTFPFSICRHGSRSRSRTHQVIPVRIL